VKVFPRLAWLVGAATVLASGSYVFIYLYRWEWHRALLAGALLVGAEVAVGIALVLRRLPAPGSSSPHSAAAAEPDPAVQARLREAVPRRDYFEWLTAGQGTSNVFIPVLLGGGIVVSALAAVVERAASAVTSPSLERGLAAELHRIALPRDGLLLAERELLAQEAPFSDDPELRLLLGPCRTRQ